MITPKEVLSLAAEDCAVRWCKGANEEVNPVTEVPERCMLGAINFHAGAPVNMYGTGDWQVDRNDSIVALRDAALKLVVEKGEIPIPSWSGGEDTDDQEALIDAVYTYNDDHDQHEVVAVLRRAAE